MWSVPSRIMREIIADTKPGGTTVGGSPIDRTRLALWLCYQLTCSYWNAPARTHCRLCGGVRA